MDVGGRNLARPHEALVVMGLLGDRRDGSRHPDAVGPHRDGDELAVLVEDPQAECIGVLAAELEDVPDLDAPGKKECSAASRALIALAHLGNIEDAIRGEVTARDEVVDVLARGVGSGDPAGSVDDTGVDDEADSGGIRLAERARADIALHERRVTRELCLVEGTGHARLQHRLKPLEVDFSVARQAHRERIGGAIGIRDGEHDVLERVGCRPLTVRTRKVTALIRDRDERIDGRGSRSVLRMGSRDPRCIRRPGGRGLDRFDVRGIVAA
ncbi:unannotated protein [freshwater metagenome]|uniref:Unannotated protein n=1 Tax=freshwater metagenome TaxID=449393 RepID=A0A6J6U9B5_9ZZZZ